MKLRNYLWLLCLFTVIPMGMKAQSSMTYTLNFNPNDFTIKQINGDTSIITSKKYDIYSNYDPTQPELPVIYVTFLLPPDAKYESFTYTKTETVYANNVVLENGVHATPISQPVSPKKEGGYILTNYSSKLQYVQTRIEGGYRMAVFKVMPIGYNAITKELFITDFTLNVQMSPTEAEKRNTSLRGINERNFVEELIWNKEDLHSYYPMRSPKRAYISPRNGTVLKNRYIIITNDSLANAFHPLVEWKKLKGLDAEIKTISTIPKRPGYSLAMNIKRYLKDIYENHPKRDSINFYVLLGGDVNIVPTVYCRVSQLFPFHLDEDVPCDMYYASVSGNNWTWDSNNNGILGEFSDVFSWNNDIYVSRASVNTIEDTNIFVQKSLSYENNPPIDTNWGDTILCLGGVSHYKYDSTYCLIEEDSKVISDSIYSQEIHPYWTGDRKYLFVTGNNLNYGYTGNSYINVDRTVEQLNKNYSFVFEISHGFHSDWGYRIQTGNESFYERDIINGIQASNINSQFPKIILTNACYSNEFDVDSLNGESYPCLSEIMMRNPESGIVAYIGSSKEGYNESSVEKYDSLKLFKIYRNSNRFSRDFIRAMYNTSVLQSLIEGKHLGQIVNYAKKDLSTSDIIERYLRFSINTLGDPELPIYTNCPHEFQLTYEPYISDEGIIDNSQMNVVVSQTDFYVYVEKDDKLYRYMIGDKFPLNVDCDSTEFVVMKQGFIPKRVKVYSSLYIQDKTFPTSSTTNISNYSRVFIGRDVYNDAIGMDVESDGDVIVSNGARLSLKAKNQIQIKNGFKVESGGTFEMDIEE